MEKFSYPFGLAISLIITIGISPLVTAIPLNFNKDVDVMWGKRHVHISKNGRSLKLGLDNVTGSSFQSKNLYLFGRFDMQIKLVANNSAGTVATFYLSSFGTKHDELDFEFLGNASGEPYTVHTNVYADGEGGREQQFRLWFDPTISFHTYSFIWNPESIIFLVDNIPLRVFYNNMSAGVPFPTSQPMWFFGSLWSADDWATQGGRVKTNWTLSPFSASYKNCNVTACVPTWYGSAACPTNYIESQQPWEGHELDLLALKRLKWVQKTHMIYNYCTDFKRFPKSLPVECKPRKHKKLGGLLL